MRFYAILAWSSILAHLLVTFVVMPRIYDHGYKLGVIAGHAEGVSVGRSREASYESGIMKAGGLCTYAELACGAIKEKKHGRK